LLAYIGSAAIYMKRKDVPRAIAAMDEAIRIGPSIASNYYHRGIAHAAEGDFERAVGDFATALELNPRDPRTRRALRQAEAERRRAAEEKAAAPATSDL
jgi:tetratricopeptide (TPR) repeat protein